MSCNNSNRPCGCNDQPRQTPPPCNVQGSCAGEPCSELFCMECITNCQPELSLIVGKSVFTLPQGMRLDEFIQYLVMAFANPACIGVAVIGLRLVSKTNTSITIRWKEHPGYNHIVTWQEGTNINTALVTSGSQYTILNLAPNTEYLIKIVTENMNCESMTMKVKTNAI